MEEHFRLTGFTGPKDDGNFAPPPGPVYSAVHDTAREKHLNTMAAMRVIDTSKVIASKLESQMARNPGLPEFYKVALRDYYGALEEFQKNKYEI